MSQILTPLFSDDSIGPAVTISGSDSADFDVFTYSSLSSTGRNELSLTLVDHCDSCVSNANDSYLKRF